MRVLHVLCIMAPTNHTVVDPAGGSGDPEGSRHQAKGEGRSGKPQ